MTRPDFRLNWSRVHRAAAAKQALLAKSLSLNGLPTAELKAAVQNFNALLAELSERERETLNNLT